MEFVELKEFNDSGKQTESQNSDSFSDDLQDTTEIKHTLVKYVVNSESYGTRYLIKGWIRELRTQNPVFAKINDGSSHESIQLVIPRDMTEIYEHFVKFANVGATIEAIGELVKSPKVGQKSELLAVTCAVTGIVQTPETFLPCAKNCPLDVLRRHQHVRPKFRTFGSVYRIRSKLSNIIHNFFQENDFHHVDPNIVTTSDCEGAGEVFTITTLLGQNKQKYDFADDFFKKQAFLTVSSQLQLEALCSGLGRVYTTNPSFRAEKSKTYRHLACFTHVEWEMAFIDLAKLMDFTEKFVKNCVEKLLEVCKEDIEALNSYVSKGLLDKLNNLLIDYERIPYDLAVKIITDNESVIREIFAGQIDKTWKLPKWGDDLGSFCEKYLCDYVYKKPLFVYNFPKELKSFYMKPNDDGKTCSSVDLLIPGLGELVGASIRTDDYDTLLGEINKRGMSPQVLEWYLDLRRNATFPHGGAGLGFDRLLTVCTGLPNIRDVVPFPVAYEECDY